MPGHSSYNRRTLFIGAPIRSSNSPTRQSTSCILELSTVNLGVICYFLRPLETTVYLKVRATITRGDCVHDTPPNRHDAPFLVLV